jgi:dihydroxy-acid dehydratase
MDTEEMIQAQPMDAAVMIGGCDKTLPAQLMGAANATIPVISLITGPQLTGHSEGERLGACTDCRRFWGKFRAGEVDQEGIDKIESRLVTTAGTCAVMGTASTMACITEALGIALPGTAAIPAIHADRLRASEASGMQAVRLALADENEKLIPNKIITPESVENALRILLSIGGSTNAIIHLTAVAGRLGIPIPLDQLNMLSDETPVLIDLKPTGEHYMEDFFKAGGLGAVLRELKPLLNLNCMTVTGQTLGERLETEAEYVDRAVVRSMSKPIQSMGGLVSLFGSLAPEGAILKRSAADPKLFETEGRAVVFSSLEDLADRIDDPNLDVKETDILVLQNAGPKSAAAMPEAGYLPIPKKLARAGVKDMVRISDARMSGTAYGTIILHVTPEAAIGGPLALVKNGDGIKISVKNRSLDLLISAEELAARREQFKPTPTPTYHRGYKKLYYDTVLQADGGCDFDFLRDPSLL